MNLISRIFAFALIFPLFVQCDVFTAMVDIENMLKNEAEATTAILDKYIQSELARLAEIRQ